MQYIVIAHINLPYLPWGLVWWNVYLPFSCIKVVLIGQRQVLNSTPAIIGLTLNSKFMAIHFIFCVLIVQNVLSFLCVRIVILRICIIYCVCIFSADWGQNLDHNRKVHVKWAEETEPPVQQFIDHSVNFSLLWMDKQYEVDYKYKHMCTCKYTMDSYCALWTFLFYRTVYILWQPRIPFIVILKRTMLV